MTIECSWGTMNYLDEGDGPFGVLLHPLAAAGTLSRHLIDDLSAHYRVLAPDARGHAYRAQGCRVDRGGEGDPR